MHHDSAIIENANNQVDQQVIDIENQITPLEYAISPRRGLISKIFSKKRANLRNPTNWVELPNEVLFMIFLFLDNKSLRNAAKTCKR
jgi:hypothetical protein